MTRLAIRTAVALVFFAGSMVAQEAAAARTWGPSAVSYVRVPATDFYPTRSSAGYTTGASSFGVIEHGRRHSSPRAYLSRRARSIVSMRFEFNDDGRERLDQCEPPCVPVRRGLLRASRRGSGTCGLRCLPAGICSGDAFRAGFPFRAADLVPDDITVDNLDHSYYVLIARHPTPAFGTRRGSSSATSSRSAPRLRPPRSTTCRRATGSSSSSRRSRRRASPPAAPAATSVRMSP